MKIGREELASAVKLASLVAGDHSVPTFTQVWLRKNMVSAYNGLIGIDVEVEGLPNIGGVDGKPMAQLLANGTDDEIDIRVEDTELRIVDGNSKMAINVIEPDAYIETSPEYGEHPFQIPTASLDEIQLETMLSLREVKYDNVPDFTAVAVWPDEDRLILFTCDRKVLHRSYLKVSEKLFGPVYIPLSFFKLLKRLMGDLREGEFAITDKYAIAYSAGDAIRFYTKLVPVDNPMKYQDIVDRTWPEGRYSKKLMVPIPDGFRDAVAKAATLAIDDRNDLRMKFMDGEIMLSYSGKRNKFSETVELGSKHPPIETTVSLNVLADVLPQTERMYLSQRTMALTGPLRFTAFIPTGS